MPVDIDGFAVLGAIARAPDGFPAVKGEVNKTARALVGKQLKDKGLTIDMLKTVARAIEFEAFDLIVDALSDAEIKALLAKVDKLNPDLKSAPPAGQRKLLVDLAQGTTSPAVKTVASKPVKAPREPKPKVERAINSKAMKASKKA